MRHGPLAYPTALLAIVVLLGGAVSVRADLAVVPGVPDAADSSSATRDLITLARDYREALERLLRFRVADVDRATTAVEQRCELYTRGIVSRRELEDAERKLDDAREKLAQTRQQIDHADRALAEALIAALPPATPAPEPEVGPRPAPAIVHHRGRGVWSLADSPRLDRFFRGRFGRALPVSAYGQTPVHDRLHLDHHQALDVALHPDSPEGSALIVFLRSAGIPFIAFREAMPGAATGAHIHVGAPSQRTATLPSSVAIAER